MRIAVCLKQVPDTESRLRIAADGKWVEEQDLSYRINESDEYALEEALRLAGDGDGEVVVFSLGPERVQDALRKALALGAARAVRLADPAFDGGDAGANARALAAALRQEEFDLVLTGSQSDDLGFTATGSLLAAELAWPHAWLVMGVEIEEGGRSVRVTREMESGRNEISRIALPAVLQIQAGLNHPRYASLKGIMQAKKKPIETIDAAGLGLAAGDVGAAGSRTELLGIEVPTTSDAAELLEGDMAAVARTLVERLQREVRVLS